MIQHPMLTEQVERHPSNLCHRIIQIHGMHIGVEPSRYFLPRKRR